MKLKFLYACAFMSAFAFTGCDDKEKDQAPAPTVQVTPEPGMTAKVDGQDWKALTPAAFTNNRFMVGGGSANSLSISLHHSGISQPGNYSVTAMIHEPIPNSQTSVYSWGDPAAKITVTKYDLSAKKVSGTFQFTAHPNPGSTGTRVVTDGIFTDIPIQ